MLKNILLILWTLHAFQAFACPEPPSEDSFCAGTGWEPFRDEKCLKLFKKWTNQKEARQLCASEKLTSESYAPTLVTIKSETEQIHFNDFIYKKSGVKSNVWLGAIRNPSNFFQFIWDDGKVVEKFENWVPSSPTNELERTCVEMQSASSRKKQRGVEGAWRDVNCELGNFVVCEKPPQWSMAKMQKLVLEGRYELGETKIELGRTKKRLEQTENQLGQTQTQLGQTRIELGQTQNKLGVTQNDLSETKVRLENSEAKLLTSQTELNTLKNNPVPIGYIYVQLPKEPEPKTIWPSVEWKDVSSEYAGLFFRAEGGDSATFGSIQEGNAPRITKVQYEWRDDGAFQREIELPIGGWNSGLGVIASWYGGGVPTTSHHFYTSGGEVRPRNMAMRIWKRVK